MSLLDKEYEYIDDLTSISAPIQSEASGGFDLKKGSWDVDITYVAKYEVSGKVVNIHDYQEGDQIQGIILDQKLFSFQGSKRIMWIKNYTLPEKVKMRITGIEYQLNSKSAKLIVEENTLYNTLIDRLLMLIKN